MSVIVIIRRTFPPDFFVSARNNNGYISSSENLGKAVIIVTQGINENDFRKGNPENHEPDFVLNNNTGIEITFASNRKASKKSSIIQLMSNYKITGIESEIIESILDSVKEKSDKKINNNYRNVDRVSVLVITLEPLLYWYGYLHGFNYPSTLRKRDEFFLSLYDYYIANSIFENLYILQLTEFKTFILYDLNAFHNNLNEFIIEIGSDKLEKLPYCEIIDVKITEESIIDRYPLITYKYNNVFSKLDRKARNNDNPQSVW